MIREATKEDLNRLISLYREYDLYENELDKGVEIDSIVEIKKRTLKFLKNKKVRIFVIEEYGEILGMVDWSIDKKNGEKRGVLNNIIINKKARGKRYGTQLVDFLIDYFKNKKCVKVYSFVRGKNIKAQKFWKDYGFNLSVNGYHMDKKL
ncbi:MAG TPA: GNAT family N-acetyltransferase [Candidatus Nanoarchaeia archaeon]|nr:GNAT family N-acetyltransferase [Candidatus Nanoarchaeia archaeon]